MYGLEQDIEHFASFEKVISISRLLKRYQISTGISTILCHYFKIPLLLGIIGKKHASPQKVYPFDYSKTEKEYSIMQVGRNITFMKQMFDEFLNKYQNRYT